jgi:hypothetical protein
MAHTPRPKGETRPHPALYPVGSKIGMMTKNGLATAIVEQHDEGGWIYVSWKETHGQQLPWYLRSTHAVLIEETNG